MAGSFPTSPDVDNYQISTGIVYFSDDNGSTYRDLGNCPNFAITPNITTKEHKRSRGGTKATDVERITEVSQTIKMDLEEITEANIAYFALADVDTDSDGNPFLLGMTNTNIEGLLRFVGDNDVGRRLTWDGKVQFIPSGDFNVIQDGDDYTKITLTAKVLIGDLGEYGRWTDRGVGG